MSNNPTYKIDRVVVIDDVLNFVKICYSKPDDVVYGNSIAQSLGYDYGRYNNGVLYLYKALILTDGALPSLFFTIK